MCLLDLDVQVNLLPALALDGRSARVQSWSGSVCQQDCLIQPVAVADCDSLSNSVGLRLGVVTGLSFCKKV